MIGLIIAGAILGLGVLIITIRVYVIRKRKRVYRGAHSRAATRAESELMVREVMADTNTTRLNYTTPTVTPIALPTFELLPPGWTKHYDKG